MVEWLVCGVFGCGGRGGGGSPWGWPQWDPTDIEGEDLRQGSVGPFTVVYWINRPREHLYVLDIVWIG